MTSLFARQALLPEGWRNNVRIECSDATIAGVVADSTPRPDDEIHAVLVPGMPNLHSHAFQRGMAGLAEMRGPGEDNFWSWRTVMYRFALSMTPDDVEAVAAQLYCEMLEAGFTRVGEFHYLHHAQDGAPYENVAEMADRIAAASASAGIGLTLLPVFYAHSSFGGATPVEGQRRFITGLDEFARLMDESRRIVAALPGANVGVAPHSLRAVTPEELSVVTALADGGPVHIHAAEQVREVEDCIAHLSARPVEWLLANGPVDANWCLIHATHMTEAETVGLARSGAVAGLCPVTEANLGDGIFNGPQFMAEGGRFGIGSDSNVLIGVADELRQLEYAQRLKHRLRNVMAQPAGSNGRNLFAMALAGGARALGVAAPAIAAGAPADLVSLRQADVEWAGDRILDGWIFAGSVGVDCVWVGGRKRVEGGRHVQAGPVARRFAAALERLTQGL